MIDVYGSEKVWEGIKNFSETFGIADIRTVEILFESYPDLPGILGNEEETKKALRQWFENNSEKVKQTHQLLCKLGSLMLHNTTSKFTPGEITPEHKEILGEVFQVLGKDYNNEESCTLC